MSVQITDIQSELKRHASKRYRSRKEEPFYLVVHHGATAAEPGDATLKAYARYHVGKGWPGIAYHYGVSPDGRCYRLNDDTTVSYHVGVSASKAAKVWPSHPLRAKGWPRPTNENCLGVVLPGNFDLTEVPAAQWDAAVALFQELAERYPKAIIIGHREVPAAFKSCPGNKFDVDRFIAEVRGRDTVNVLKVDEVQAWYAGQMHEPLGEAYGAAALCPDEPLRQRITAHLNALHRELVAAQAKAPARALLAPEPQAEGVMAHVARGIEAVAAEPQGPSAEQEDEAWALGLLAPEGEY